MCFPVPVIQKVLIAAQQKKVLDSLVVVLNSDIRSYEIAVKELSIKDSTNKEIIATYENIIKAKDEQRKILEGEIVSLNKQIKKWKRKTRLTAIAGVLTTIGGIVVTAIVLK
jgi:membrane-bound lytic murein transglycosylase